MWDLLRNPSRYLFFTGKGGVGKTSLSCATAIALADAGKRVLLVSTDPASNLDEVLGCRLGAEPREIPGTVGLLAINIDPIAAAAAYREKVVGPYRDILPESTIANMEEQLSGACTVEIAAFDKFAGLLSHYGQVSDFDHIVFDTAPTGHTLRLLSLPNAWKGYLDQNTHGSSCLGPLAGLAEQHQVYTAAVQALADPVLTTLVLVSRPEASALLEAERARHELAELGMHNQQMILNGMFSAQGEGDPLAAALEQRGRQAVADMPAGLRELPQEIIPLVPRSLVGVESLRTLLEPSTLPTAGGNGKVRRSDLPRALAPLIAELAKRRRGVVMTMGKGGVGKTTVAAAVAVELARQGFPVHLTTTDPAAHVEATLAGRVDGLRVSHIDGKEETARYTQEVVDTVGRDMDPASLALLEEDLRSPCTEEVAVFRAFAKIVAEAEDGFVVVDTAPTGHTILLLDAAESYHREVTRKVSDAPEAIRNLLPRLRDPEFCRLLIIVVPQATPVHEAEVLQNDLRRAGIEPYSWVINQSFLAGGPSDSWLAAYAAQETNFIERVRSELSERCTLVPWLSVPPVGVTALAEMVRA